MRSAGRPRPTSPVIISVPHAGRAYPPELADLVRLPLSMLKPLEDRYVDLLAHAAEFSGHRVLIAETPRCIIDLNRGEDEVDPLLTPMPGPSHRPSNAKIRAGLGLIPRRIAVGGEIWRQPISKEEVMDRIHRVHRPWHTAIATAIEDTRAAFGCAVLIDLHSMPTPPSLHPPQFVIGDRFGKSASRRISEAAVSLVASEGYRPALNAPYAGGHTLDRHGRPHQHVHAVQVEVDRALYLDRAQDRPIAAISALQDFIARLADSLAEEALSLPIPLAAE